MNGAELYSKHNGLQRTDTAFVLKKYFHLVKWRRTGSESVLDVGCGDGNVTVDLLLPLLGESFKELVGADVSQEMVEYAKAHNGRAKVHYVQIDMSAKELNCDLEDGFDHIFSFYCLHWIQEQRQCVENLFKLLKPAGDMLITFLATNPIFKVYENLSKHNKWSAYMQNVRNHVSPYQNSENPAKEFRTILIEAGFSVHMCKVVNRTYTFPDFTVWKKSIIAVNPFLSKIPENMREDYISDFFDEVKKLKYIMPGDDNNNGEKIYTKHKLFVVYASKSK